MPQQPMEVNPDGHWCKRVTFVVILLRNEAPNVKEIGSVTQSLHFGYVMG
jgi:hypothetical protein